MAALTSRQKIVGAGALVVAALVGGVIAAVNLPVSSNADALTFTETFENSADFATLFDHGYSGPNPWDWPPGEAVLSFQGDHDASTTSSTTCGNPLTFRSVAFGGDRQALDFSQLFWWCAPSGAGSGHLMTGVNTISYNYAWFSPKQPFSQITKVCWDLNETELSSRKWTQIMFVSAADAVRYPSNRGTGGYDLGYVSPDSADPNGPTTGIITGDNSIAGLEDALGAFSWFDHNEFKSRNVSGQILGVTDKATRYRHCVENASASQIKITQDTPTGTRTFTVDGQIPQDARRVVFEDNTYNAPKADNYNANVLTWHWDNIQIFTAATAPPTTLPGSSTSAPSTTAPTTTQPSTTSTTAPTTTNSTTTTVGPTTTLPPTTTTTLAPIPACPSGFTTAQRNWCLAVNAHIAALEAKVH